jgi:HAD superfamily hydrolase (TIGR01509 family)
MTSTPAPPALVIFDCDGVLVDSERLAVEIDVRAIGALGWTITREEVIERHVGRSTADVIADIEAHIGRSIPQGWDVEWDEEYRRVFDEELEAVPGVQEAVRVLDAQGLATCVASSGSHRKMRRTLGRTGLWDHFEGRVFSVSQVERGKPAPDLFLYAAQQLGIAPGRCVVVEDSRFGVAGAKAADMVAIGYAGGITPAVHLEAADTVITDMADLPAAVAALLDVTA